MYDQMKVARKTKQASSPRNGHVFQAVAPYAPEVRISGMRYFGIPVSVKKTPREKKRPLEGRFSEQQIGGWRAVFAVDRMAKARAKRNVFVHGHRYHAHRQVTNLSSEIGRTRAGPPRARLREQLRDLFPA